MRLRIQREELLRPLQQVVSVVERRQTLPILMNVLVRAEEKGIFITGTDLEMEVVAETSAEAEISGAVTVPARKLVEIWRALPEGAVIDVSEEGDRLVIRSGRSRFLLATLPAGDFPVVERASVTDEFSISQARWKRLLEATQFAMAIQDVRYYLNGLLVELSPGRVRLVATDGHRLAFCESDVEGTPQQEIKRFILPRKAVLELGRLLEDEEEAIRCEATANQMRFELPGVVLTTKLIDGRFPEYDHVIPDRSERAMSVPREDLRRGLARVGILSNEKYRGVRVLVEGGRLRLVANNPEQEEAEEELEVTYGGCSVEVGFNVNYVLDAVAAVEGEEVVIHFGDAGRGCLIESAGGSRCRYVVMPMRL
jgi:DNA polymerase-3 subunit beta